MHHQPTAIGDVQRVRFDIRFIYAPHAERRVAQPRFLRESLADPNLFFVDVDASGVSPLCGSPPRHVAESASELDEVLLRRQTRTP